jgi:hypothetical protein
MDGAGRASLWGELGVSPLDLSSWCDVMVIGS